MPQSPTKTDPRGREEEIQTIRIHHECEVGIEQSVPRITDWHHEACRGLSRGCARNDRITLDIVSCDTIVPGAATRRDPTHQIKLLK